MPAPIVFNDKKLTEIEKLAGVGLTQEDIAAHLGFSRPQFKRKDVKKAYEIGKLKAAVTVRTSMYKMAINNNHRSQFMANKWWSSVHLGLSENNMHEPQSTEEFKVIIQPKT